MTDQTRISDAEWTVMQQLWDRHPQTANELAHTLCRDRSWKPKTVKTLISRLLAKEVIGFSKNGREYLYFPRVERKACVQAASRSFLDRVYRGAAMPMVAHLIESRALSKKDIEELRQLLETKTKR